MWWYWRLSNTNAISSFKIISESGVAAGVRRIEALTSTGLMKHYKESENVLNQAAKLAKSEPVALVEKIQALYDEIKELSKENEKLKAKLANESCLVTYLVR